MREPRHWPTQCLTNLLFTENALVQAVPGSPILHLGWRGYAQPTAQSVYCPSNSIPLWATYLAPPHIVPSKMGPVCSLPSSDPAGSKEKKVAPTSGSGGESTQPFAVLPYPLHSSPHLLSYSVSFSVWEENDKNASS